MSEDQAHAQPEADPTTETAGRLPTEPVHTGLDRVNAVVRSVQGLADRPVDEHVGVYESAHAELRRTLDEPPAAVDADPTSD